MMIMTELYLESLLFFITVTLKNTSDICLTITRTRLPFPDLCWRCFPCLLPASPARHLAIRSPRVPVCGSQRTQPKGNPRVKRILQPPVRRHRGWRARVGLFFTSLWLIHSSPHEGIAFPPPVNAPHPSVSLAVSHNVSTKITIRFPSFRYNINYFLSPYRLPSRKVIVLS